MSADPSAREDLAHLLELVDEGLARYAKSSGRDPEWVRWDVTDMQDRPGSTVLEIEARFDAGAAVTCFAKRFSVPPGRPTMARRLRDRVERTATVTDRLGTIGRSHEVGVATTLAYDVDALALVSLGVGGRPLGKALTHALTPARRRRAEHIYPHVGEAMRTVETVSTDLAPQSSYLSVENVEKAMSAVVPFLGPDERRRTEAIFSDLHNAYVADPGESYFCHGDINRSNVLVDGDWINLIDFDLSSRPVTYDLSMLLMRLEMERPRLASWQRQVSSWVIEGYGGEQAVATPAFHLVRLIKVGFGVQRNADKNRPERVRRFLRSLRSTVAAF